MKIYENFKKIYEKFKKNKFYTFVEFIGIIF